jgi:tetratricopeptide (TPR) repeat protein
MSDAEQTDPAAPLPPAGMLAEQLSTQALHIRFVGRRREMDGALAHLLSKNGDANGRILVVHGDSGTGKTFFSRHLVRELGVRLPDALYLYIDIANDEYQSSRTIIALLKMALVPGPMSAASVISVPEALTLEQHRRQVRKRGVGRGFLKGIARGIGAFLGIGSAVGAALDEVGGNAAQLEDELVAYLSWAAKKQPVFIAIDNLQFLNLDVRLTIESILQRVGRNVRMVVVDRTVEGVSELDPPIRCFADNCLEIGLANLTEEETRWLVMAAVSGEEVDTERLADDIYTKTAGLAKDVEYCLRQYVLELGEGARAGAIEGLLSTIDRLPVIHRQFLVIATLLDGGVKKAIAEGTVARLTALRESNLSEVVDDLVARDYLRVNSESGDRLRPGHERIATAIRDLADDELHEEVRRSLIEELASALEAPDAEESETYVLHCLVGLQTARELSRNLHYISRLIQSQHRQDQFSYLVAISEELQEVLPMLPEHILDDLLDAMQKSSAFDQGLQLVRQLDAAGVPGAATRRIHRLKYLTQAYRYDEALALSRELGPGEWGDVYRVNALLALDRLDEARAIVSAHRTQELSEDQAVMRRNTIILFDGERALKDLDEAQTYFEREQSRFRLATIETNRSVVYLNMRRFGDALRSLDRAIDHMQYVESREVYQAQINLAVRSALRQDYGSALKSLDAAALHVPRALVMDQVKISMNRCAIECAGGERSRHEGAEAFVECLERIRGLQMPYLQRSIERNLAVARGGNQVTGVDEGGYISLDVTLPANGGVAGAWTLLMSIHWRY